MSAQTIGTRIQRDRIGHGWSQRELADLVGVGYPHISKVENDQEPPSDGLLERLADTLGADVDEYILLTGHIPVWYREFLTKDPVQGAMLLRSMRLGVHDWAVRARVSDTLYQAYRELRDPIEPDEFDRMADRVLSVVTQVRFAGDDMGFRRAAKASAAGCRVWLDTDAGEWTIDWWNT